MNAAMIWDRCVTIAANLHQIRDPRLVRIADDPRNARQRRDFFGRALRIAAGDQNARIRIFTMRAPDGASRVPIGGGSDCACVQDHQIGGGAFAGGGVSAGRELRFERGAIGLRGPASEILNEKGGQISV
jgi:hypothetical protein